MDRKRYLELCQRNAVEPNSVNVIYQSGKYYPLALKIWVDGNGKTKTQRKWLLAFPKQNYIAM